MRQILSITRKELTGYFGSPLAVIFLGAFLIAVLFVFFNVERFFARGIADIRPLFQWMPILLIFLIGALTMRQWSEEQRTGTMEMLLTLPVDLFQLVVGKFLAVMAMIAISLALTIFLPLTVEFLGDLDWGPVFGGYLATILMAGAYAAIGLYVSSRTDNQVVSLISTVLLCGLFYIVGTRQITDFFGGSVSNILWAIGTGSRFESIQRGVIDLRDLVYYLSLTGIFLTLNVFSLDSIRWSEKQIAYQRRFLFTVSLILVNLVSINAWLFPLQGLRVDLTERKEFTISQTTRDLLNNLQEPLLIRAYISDKTHPLLSPLTPQIQDMLREYEIASHGKITADVIDPLKDSNIEAEARAYGIRSTPFQITGRYEASVVNSYFDILVRYGDQSVTLNFKDLIEVNQVGGQINVSLRNLEYDLTRAIKKVVYGFQSIDAVLAALDQPVKLTLFVTPNLLPNQLTNAVDVVKKVAGEIQSTSNGKFEFVVVNPDDPKSSVGRQVLIDKYGLQPFPTGLFSNDTFFFHMLLENGKNVQVLYPVDQMEEADVRTMIESALKRSSTGFLKNVGLWTPPTMPTQDMFGQTQQPLSTYQLINEQLGQEYQITQVDLATGVVPAQIDALVLIAPQGFTDKELFAIDQFLMRGGSVIIAASNYHLDIDQMQGFLVMKPVEGGVEKLLEHYGVSIAPELIMDTQSEPFPIAVNRKVGNTEVQEIRAMNYPFFVDIRPNAMQMDSPIVSSLSAVTLNWPSPVQVDENKNSGRKVNVLLRSSSQSWKAADTNVQPDFNTYPELGFPAGTNQQSYPLAVSIQGSFESYFKGKSSPFQNIASNPDSQSGPPAPGEKTKGDSGPAAIMDRSPDAARLVVIGSAEFTNDFVLNLSSRLTQDRFLNNLRLMQNAVDWSVEDLDLLSIRSRGNYTRSLLPMGEFGQTFWEVLNYILALLALIVVYVVWHIRKRNIKPLQLLPDDAKGGKS